jgi:pimeloyl-ACP methyl ester carboxylesterase
MELCPGEDESQLAATEGAVDDLQIVDSHLGFSFGMASMEVREAVIVEEHDDGYPKEAADRRHASAAGEEDMVDFRNAVTELAAKLPEATTATIAGCGHLAPLEAPEEFRRLVFAHLETLR